MAGRLRSGLAAAVLAIAAGGTPAHAAPTWLAPTTISGLGGQAPAVAMNAQGDVVAAWSNFATGDNRIEAAFRPAGGAFTAPQILACPCPGPTGGADAAIDGQGNAVVVWVLGNESRVQAAFRPAGGSFGTPETLDLSAAPEAGTPAVAMDPAGNALAIWEGTDGTHIRIKVAFRAPGGTFGAIQTLSDAGQGARSPQIAMNPQGDAIVIWEHGDGTNSRAQAAFRPAGGTFGPAQTISGAGEDAFRPGIALAGSGDALAIWKGVTPCEGPCPERVRTAFRPAGGSFGAPVAISDTTGGCDCPEPPPGIGFDAFGNAIAVWIQLPGDPVNSLALAAFRPAGGAFGSPQALGPAGRGQEGIRLAVDPEGAALAFWPRSDGAPLAAFRAPGGAFGSAQSVGGSPAQAGAFPRVAMDGQGDGIAAWQLASQNPANTVVLAAGFDGAGPRLDGLQFPATGPVGSLLPFSVSPLDVWSSVASTSWAFGDGGSAVGSAVSYAYDRAGTFSASVTSTDTLGNSSSAQSNVVVTGSAGRAALSRFIVPKSIHLDKLLSRGLPVIVFNAAGGTKDDVSLLARPSDLRAAAVLKTIGRKVRLRQSAGKHKIRVRPTRKYRRRLALLNRKTLKLKVKIVVSASGLSRSTVIKTVTVKR